MKEYHKIQTVWLRDPETKFKTLLTGQWATPELEYLQECDWIFTEKVDGMNIRIMWDGERITFGGKTDNAQIPASLVAALEEEFFPQIDKFKEKFGTEGHVCLYGEGHGAKIQKGGEKYRDNQGFVMFDVKIGDWWLKDDDVWNIAAELEVEKVPTVGTGNLHDLVNMVRKGVTSWWGDFPAEGIVARPLVELTSRSGHRIITKLKAKDFPS